MSEEKKYETEVLNLLKTIAEQTKPSPKEESSEPVKPAETHTHFKEGDEICPTCKPAVQKSILEGLFKDKKVVKCKECGLPVAEESEECPSCGGTEAESY